ncbi:cupin domain-containing protein [Deinococcus sp. AJ005]|uniref:cupin domain-containing protein n=1 Tax=Deinococcus sp. AJ005 TaxID=2652443 RepID=UPI00125CB8AF|nr:cupin domain-containing protein [Deinococcus sp. AJ005]QFP76100.1 cupin domain-containing protein [Deinococcus sp. AJ005]
MTTEPTDIQRAAPPQVLTVTPHGRSLLFTLETGQGIPPHRHPSAQAILAVLSGEIEVRAQTTQTLKAGEVAVHDGNESISLLALQPGQVLVTLLGG